MQNITRRNTIKISIATLLFSSNACIGDSPIPSGHSLNSHPTKNVFFPNKEFAILRSIADTMIPNTDTPGAISAGVPEIIDSMMNNWASSEQRLDFRRSINNIYKSLNLIVDDFVNANYQMRFHALNTIDDEVFSDSNSDTNEYAAVKEFIVDVYYTSEIGASEELIYEANPGVWKPCVPFSQVGRSWAV